MAAQGQEIIVAKRPTGDIVPDEIFELKAIPIPQQSDLKDGQVVVEALYLSFDPVSRLWLNGDSYVPVHLGKRMPGYSLVRVLASKAPGVAVGDVGKTWAGWVTHTIIEAKDFSKIDVLEGTKLTQYLGLLGYPGLTGYFGMTRIAKPKEGETVVVSTAAGATGSAAAQIAKILVGATGRVVGIAGGDDKVKWLKELGLDEAINYRDADFEEKFAKAVPNGIDVYYDNVGGRMLELALDNLNKYGRVAICGDSSNYNNPKPVGIRNYMRLATSAGSMMGVLISDFEEEHDAGRKVLHEWIQEGKLQDTETIYEGKLEDAPNVLVDLFKGKNIGKMALRIKS